MFTDTLVLSTVAVSFSLHWCAQLQTTLSCRQRGRLLFVFPIFFAFFYLFFFRSLSLSQYISSEGYIILKHVRDMGRIRLFAFKA